MLTELEHTSLLPGNNESVATPTGSAAVADLRSTHERFGRGMVRV